MKTIEEKAKRYYEAYKVAESIHRFSSNPAEIKLMEEIFPSLKEYEGERIRNVLIGWINLESSISFGDTFDGFSKEQILAWLEKQGEQKSFDYENANIPQKDSTWGEEDKHWMQKVIDFMNHPDFIKTMPTLAKDTINWLKSLEERVIPQQKQYWSKDDSTRLQRVINFLWQNRKGDTDTIYQQEQDIDWLKSLKDRVQPQSKQEWSEEDESNFQGIIDVIKENKHHATDYEHMTYYKLLSWFKSLKDRYTWKPSEEQMNILSIYAHVHDGLASLYQDLKKLKG